MGPRPDLFQSRLPALGSGDLESLVPEQDPERVQDARLIIDDQHRRLLTHAASSATILAGRKMVKVVPDPAADSTSTSPRCASTAR